MRLGGWFRRLTKPDCCSVSCIVTTTTITTATTTMLMVLLLIQQNTRGVMASTSASRKLSSGITHSSFFSTRSTAFQQPQPQWTFRKRSLSNDQQRPLANRLLLLSGAPNQNQRQLSPLPQQRFMTMQQQQQEQYPATIISSTKSNTVKQFQTLLKKSSHRMEMRQTIVEGPRIVTELFDNVQTRSLIRHVIISSDYQGKYPQFEVGDEVSKDYYQQPNYRVSYVTPQVLKACTDTVTPQGIAALVDIPSTFMSLSKNSKNSLQDDTRSPTTTTTKSNNKYPLYLVLDGVSDPGNVGTLLRSSLAVGVAGIILLPECCDVWNPKAIRSAMGSTFYLPQIIQVPTWKAAVSWLQDQGQVRSVYAATMLEEEEEKEEAEGTDMSGNGTKQSSHKNQAHFDIDWTVAAPCALVIGSEGKGLNQDIRQALMHTTGSSSRNDQDHDGSLQLQAVHVPMVANSMESLNAAVCGSVILFDYLRQTNHQTPL